LFTAVAVVVEVVIRAPTVGAVERAVEEPAESQTQHWALQAQMAAAVVVAVVAETIPREISHPEVPVGAEL